MGRSKKKNPYVKDRFTQQAKDEGYKARSVYKLTEIDRRFRVFRPGQKVIDLGCYPGSWSQYAMQKIGRKGALVGVDLSETILPKGTFMARDIFKVSAEELVEALGGPPDIVMSDMAPKTTGVAHTDHVRQMVLVRQALEVAKAVLKPGGTFITKVFDGEEVPEFQNTMRPLFGKSKRIRPPAVRQVSREFFFLAMDFKG